MSANGFQQRTRRCWDKVRLIWMEALFGHRLGQIVGVRQHGLYNKMTKQHTVGGGEGGIENVKKEILRHDKT
jgi:hypothetical protein